MATPVGLKPGAAKPPTRTADDDSGPVAGKPYTVKPKDTLWLIAQRAYGNGEMWPSIRDANPGKVVMRDDGVAVIKPGTQLDLPPAPSGKRAKAATKGQPKAKAKGKAAGSAAQPKPAVPT